MLWSTARCLHEWHYCIVHIQYVSRCDIHYQIWMDMISCNTIAQIIRNNKCIAQLNQQPLKREDIAGCFGIASNSIVRYQYVSFDWLFGWQNHFARKQYRIAVQVNRLIYTTQLNGSAHLGEVEQLLGNSIHRNGRSTMRGLDCGIVGCVFRIERSIICYQSPCSQLIRVLHKLLHIGVLLRCDTKHALAGSTNISEVHIMPFTKLTTCQQ